MPTVLELAQQELANRQSPLEMAKAELARRSETQELRPNQNPDGTYGRPPQEMVFDPRTGGYVDTALAAERMGMAQGAGATYLMATPFAGESVDNTLGAISGQTTGANPRIAAETMRQSRSQFQEAHPIAAGAIGLGSGIINTLPALAVAGPGIVAKAGTSLAGRMLQGAALGTVAGATEGAISGAGAGDYGNRAESAKSGAAIGGGLGFALGAAAPAVGAGIRKIWQRFSRSDTRAIAKELGVSPETAAVIREAFDNDDIDAAEAAIRAAGGEAMLADAGSATRSLLDASVATGGQAGRVAREAVEERATGASAQMQSALDRYLGAPQGKATLVSGIRTGTEQARREAYDAAYDAAIDYSTARGRSLESMFSRLPDDVINRANRLMQVEGNESRQILAEIAEDGTATFKRMPDVMQWDYITRALNDVAKTNDGAGALGGQTQLGASFGNLSKSIRSRLRGLVPEYGTALDTASDAISRRNSVETGYTLLRAGTKRDEVADALRGASVADRDALRQGLRSYIDDTLAQVTRTVTDPSVDAREAQRLLRDLSSRSSIEKLQLILGERQATALGREIERATISLELRAAVARNSATAIRTSIQGGVKSQTQSSVLDTLRQGKPVDAFKRLVQVFNGQTPEAIALRQQGIFDEIAEVLVNTRGEQAARSLRVIKLAMEGQPISNSHARLISRTLTSGLGVGSYQLGTQALTSGP